MGTGVGAVVRRLRARQEEIEEAVGGLREMSRAQAALLDRLVIGVTREHVAEPQRAGRSHEHRLLERVRRLLAGENLDDHQDENGGVSSDALSADLGYGLEAEHVGLVGWGTGVRQLLGELAGVLERELLCVPLSDGTMWAWLGGEEGLCMADLEQALVERRTAVGVAIAAGESWRGLEGWRRSHRQAQAARLVALRRAPRRLTRYGEVALLSSALRDRMLAQDLADVYLAPLDDEHGGGAVLRQTLRAYIAAECNVSSTAAALGVARNTIDKRLRTSEARLGRTLHPCPAELVVALGLEDVSLPAVAGGARI